MLKILYLINKHYFDAFTIEIWRANIYYNN
jgi:hypothetical protein